MSDNEYLTHVAIGERLREARAHAAVLRRIEDARASGAADARRSRRRRRPLRAYGAVARSLISRWRNWRPA
jgi:hypothetical protein